MAKISINLKTGTAKKDNEIIVGIDLGTTNSLVAYMKDGEAVAVKGDLEVLKAAPLGIRPAPHAGRRGGLARDQGAVLQEQQRENDRQPTHA